MAGISQPFQVTNGREDRISVQKADKCGQKLIEEEEDMGV
jgi:hypothetical protein